MVERAMRWTRKKHPKQAMMLKKYRFTLAKCPLVANPELMT